MNQDTFEVLKAQFGENNTYFLRSIVERFVKNEETRLVAENNDLSHFETWLRPLIGPAMRRQLAQNDDTVSKYMALSDFEKDVFNGEFLGMRELWQKHHKPE